MSSYRQRAADGLRPGDCFKTSRIFTANEVRRFAELSKDYNPVHFEPRFAQVKGLEAPICHGLLTASLVTEIGGQIAWLASSVAFNFKLPVYVGERLDCRFEITEVEDNGWAKALIEVRKPDGSLVIDGQIKGLVPRRPEQEVLQRMLLEGDPTNRL